MRYLSVESLRLMCDLLREPGLDASGLLDAADVSPAQLLDPTVRVAGRDELAAIRLFRQRAAEPPTWAVRLGQGYRLATFGFLGMAMLYRHPGRLLPHDEAAGMLGVLRAHPAASAGSRRHLLSRCTRACFADASTFCQAFRRWSGQTPSAFRKAAKLDELTYDLSSII